MTRSALQTLPARWYTDPQIHEQEIDAIFGASWQYAGRADRVAEPGCFLTAQAGRVPIVVVRDGAGILRAHVNVCRHRFHPLCSGSGRASTLQCPYHAWTYDLDGSLRAVPRADSEPDLELDGIALLPARVEELGPWVFVHPDPSAGALAGHLGDLPEVLRSCGLRLETLEHERSTEWELRCNWKIAVENYLECYHCAINHAELARLVDVRPEAYALHLRDTFSFQVGPVREATGTFAQDGAIPRAQWHWLWPNVAINVEPGPQNVSIDVWAPDGPGRTVGRTDYFFAPEVPREAREEIMAFSARLGEEDRALVEAVQRGVESRAVESGRVLPVSEQLITRFHDMVRAVVTAHR